MKKIIFPILLLALILCGCNQKLQQPVQSIIQPMEESTQAPTQKKILLELQQFNLDESSYEGEEAETEETSVLLEDLTLPETALKTYENDDFMVPVAAVLKEELGLILDGRWKFYIHYYTQEQNVGILSVTYWVDGIIATNKSVTLPIENGTIRTAIYSYLDRSLDEQTLLDKYEQFRDTHEQERISLERTLKLTVNPPSTPTISAPIH